MSASESVETTEAGAADARTALLDAALAIATSRGYVGTTISQVRKRTGISASSVYWHFEDKDELIAEALSHGFEKWRASHGAWDPVGDLSDPEATLLHQLTVSTTGLEQEPGFWRLGLMIGLEEGPTVGSKPRARFAEIRTWALSRIEGEWRRSHPGLGDREYAHLTRLTMAALDGLYTAYLSDGAELITALVPAIAHGLTRVAEDLRAGVLDIAAVEPIRTPRRRAPKATAVVDSRSALLRAAAAVAAESGYAGASIARICAKAGLPASSLYWFFESKDDLFNAVVQHSYDEWMSGQPTLEEPAPGAPWHEALRAHWGSGLRSFVLRPDYLRLGCLLLLQETDEHRSGRERFLQIRQDTRASLTAWFASVLEGPDRDEVARRMSRLGMLLSDGLFYSLQLDDSPWDPAVLSLLGSRLMAHAVDGIA